MIINNLQILRKASNKTQKQVANDTGIPLRTLQRYEKGDSIGDPEYLCLLMSYYNISVNELLSKNRSI